jgi:hypothetical protein
MPAGLPLIDDLGRHVILGNRYSRGALKPVLSIVEALPMGCYLPIAGNHCGCFSSGCTSPL